MTKRKDLTSMVFGRLTVMQVDSESAPGKLKWLCRCSCGTSKSVLADSLMSGKTGSCGCLRKAVHSETYKEVLVGRKFSMLTVISSAENSGEKTRWLCLCDCGKTKVAGAYDLKSGATTSCGCAKSERAKLFAEKNRSKIKAGDKFGMLTVVSGPTIKWSKSRSLRRSYEYVCSCDCGGSKILDGCKLTGGAVISCGCASRTQPGLLPRKRLMAAAAHVAKRRAQKNSAGGSFTPAQVDELFLKQRGRCANCGIKLGDKFHRDHKIALALGGNNDISNIELLCPACNIKKHAKDPVSWAQENGRLL